VSVLSLWTKHRRLAYAIAAEFHLPGAESQDVEQEALIGLWVAARDWDRDGGASFPTFARLVIRRRLAAVLRAALREKHRPLNDAVRMIAHDDGEVAIVDTLAGGRDPFEVVVLRQTLERLIEALASLTELERTALAIVVFDGRYAHEKVLDNAVYRARDKLRTAMAEAPTA
jgi:RNA polymerase sporulation-specific sigma factor